MDLLYPAHNTCDRIDKKMQEWHFSQISVKRVKDNILNASNFKQDILMTTLEHAIKNANSKTFILLQKERFHD